MDLFKSEVLVTFIVFGFFYLMFDLIIRRQERRMLIDKISDLGRTDLNRVLPRDLRGGYSRGGWFHAGCALVGIGLGAVVAFFVCVGIFPGYVSGYYEGMNTDAIGVVYTAFICLFGGLGLVIAYIIDNKMNNKRND